MSSKKQEFLNNRRKLAARNYHDNVSLYLDFSEEEIQDFRKYLDSLDESDQDHLLEDLIHSKDWRKAELFIRAKLIGENKCFNNSVGYNFVNYDLNSVSALEYVEKIILPENSLEDIINGFRFYNKFRNISIYEVEDILQKLEERFTEEDVEKDSKRFQILFFFLMDKEFENGNSRFEMINSLKKMDSKFLPVMKKLQKKLESEKIIYNLELFTEQDEEAIDNLPVKIMKSINIDNPVKMAKYINKKSETLNQDDLHYLVYDLISRNNLIGYYHSESFNDMLDKLQELGCKATKMVQEIIELYASCGYDPDSYFFNFNEEDFNFNEEDEDSEDDE